MKYNIHYTKESRRDLDEIWDYIFSELQNISAAEQMVNRIMDAADQLADFAEIGAPLSSIADVDSDYRFLVTGNYLTFYRVCGSDIYVDRVLYGRRDYLCILVGDTYNDEAKAVMEGLEDVKAGRTVDGDKAISDIKEKYGI